MIIRNVPTYEPLHALDGPPIRRTEPMDISPKRLLDLSLTCAILLAALPIMGITAVVIWIGLGRPILFSQHRAGLRGRIFRIHKFRSMTYRRDSSGNLLPDAQRLGSLGRFLRKTSLDELPQLWHVLKGDLSLVGPRPLLVHYLPLYSPLQHRRHEVKPGITGWAQINGRNAVSWAKKFELDVWYVDHQSLWLDLTILWRTITLVLSQQAISQPGHETAREFTGTL